MQNNAINNYQPYPQQGPNAVNISIYSPQAYGNTPACNPIYTPASDFYSIYGTNPQPNLPLYPANYNNMIGRPNANSPLYPANYNNGVTSPQQNPAQYPQDYANASGTNQQNPALYPGNDVTGTEQQSAMPNNQANKTANDTNVRYSVSENSDSSSSSTEDSKKTKDKKEKTITPLNDDYIKSIENYLNDSNQKIRIIGAKELLERLKEDENRKDNPSLIPLVNKILQDPSPTVRFLGLTMLQLDYCTGDNETVALLNKIQQENKDKIGQEQLLASQILLKMSAPDKIKIRENK